MNIYECVYVWKYCAQVDALTHKSALGLATIRTASFVIRFPHVSILHFNLLCRDHLAQWVQRANQWVFWLHKESLGWLESCMNIIKNTWALLQACHKNNIAIGHYYILWQSTLILCTVTARNTDFNTLFDHSCETLWIRLELIYEFSINITFLYPQGQTGSKGDQGPSVSTLCRTCGVSSARPIEGI